MASSTDPSNSASGIPLKYKIGVPLAIVFLFLCAVGIAFLATRYATAKNGQANSEPSDCGTVMSMKSRQNLLHWHNKYRSIVAKGEYEITTQNGKLRKLPPAKRMPQLKYNCSLEESSLKWANTVQCVMKHSHYPGVGENLFGITGEHTQEETANTATKPWADEIAKYGISALNEYRDEIGHATQVLWAETLTVGCGIKKCSNGWTMAVCQYYPPGNGIGSPMYKEGKTLSECGLEGRNEVPHFETGLCELL
ncbi:hypothetical protein RB195_009364 [Necator americanus]|uniref:SCP domain-containing protein n=1 Tax=Necator americanus TaxID=51031 RepID=A0ABR1CUV8_NECAM